jgi:hypothetical protein
LDPIAVEEDGALDLGAAFDGGTGNEVGFKDASVLVSGALVSLDLEAVLLAGCSLVLFATGTIAGFNFGSVAVIAPATLRNLSTIRLAVGVN